MKKPSKRVVLIGAVVALAAGGAVGGALAASGTLDPKAERQAFLNDAAGRLGTTSAKLEDALKQAAIDRVDAALAAGRITKGEADAMKAAINAGELPIGIPGAGPGFGHGPGFRAGDFLDAAATYLGLSDDQLRTQLESGKSLADVAKAQNKSVDGLKQAIIAAVQSKLDQAVKDGRLTSDQESQILAKVKASIDNLVNGTLPARPPGAYHDGFRLAPGGFHAPLPAEAPAAFGPSA
jgi:hypothetical protein